jgi:hypothetical protein
MKRGKNWTKVEDTGLAGLLIDEAPAERLEKEFGRPIKHIIVHADKKGYNCSYLKKRGQKGTEKKGKKIKTAVEKLRMINKKGEPEC